MKQNYTLSITTTVKEIWIFRLKKIESFSKVLSKTHVDIIFEND